MDTLIPNGLDAISAVNTRIGSVDGDAGFFHYRQYSAVELSRLRTFESTWFLLQSGWLPNNVELRAFGEEMLELVEVVQHQLDQERVGPLDLSGDVVAQLRTQISYLGHCRGMRSWLDVGVERYRCDANLLTAGVAAVLARALGRDNRDEGGPRSSWAERYLASVVEGPVDPLRVRALDAYLTITADHGMNASTFTARVVASTGADAASAMTAAIGAMSGPLHGGAPGRVLAMLTEIATPENARAWVIKHLDAGERIMGFGHRVYRDIDPRAEVLRMYARSLGGSLVGLAVAVEEAVLTELNARHPQRSLPTNVEFWAGVVLAQLGLAPNLFTPTFILSRMVGWSAHIVEQAGNNRLIRPQSTYVGVPAPQPVPSLV